MPAGHFYKWEENNRGLDHNCGTCKTSLSSPRAKKTCLGLHQEVCTRYHKTLFFLGQSHNCDACYKTDELHDKRHREIVKLIQSARKHDGLVSTVRSPSAWKRKQRKTNIQHRKARSGRSKEPGEEAIKPRSDSMDELDQSTAPDQVEDFEELSLDEWNDTSTLDEEQADQMACDQANLIVEPKYRKAAKAKKKRAKHQAQIQTITENDLRGLDRLLHPDQSLIAEKKSQDTGQGLAQNETIKNNISFHKQTHKNPRISVHDKKQMQASHGKELPETLKQKRVLIDHVLQTLDLTLNLTRAKRGRKALDHKIREAMYADIVAVMNEQSETMQRMAGYWRYVNRRTYNAMVRMNEIWDWATGTKLPEVDEEADLDNFSESASDDTLVGPVDQLCDNSEPHSTQVENENNAFDLYEHSKPAELIEPSEATTTTPVIEGTRAPIQTGAFQEDRLLNYAKRHYDAHDVSSWTRSSIPALTFSTPPLSSDDGFRNGPDTSLEGGRAKTIPVKSKNRKNPLRKSPTSVKQQPKHPSAGDGKHQIQEKTDLFIYPKKIIPRPKKNLQPRTLAAYKATLSAPTIKDEVLSQDQNNRFRGLKIEIAAPKEEEEKDTELTTPKPASFRSMRSSKMTTFTAFLSSTPSSNPTPSVNHNNTKKDDQQDFPALPLASSPSPGRRAQTQTQTKAQVLSISSSAVMLLAAKEHDKKTRVVGRGKTKAEVKGKGKVVSRGK